MNTVSLIANSGIQFVTTRVNIRKDETFCRYFYESVNPINKRCSLEAVYRLEEQASEGEKSVIAYFNLRPLIENGWLAPGQPISIALLKQNGISPVFVEGEEQENGKIYKIDLNQASEVLGKFENTWLPLPYFYQRKKQNGEFIFRKLGPLNWSRFKLIPCASNDEFITYDVAVAFETRAKDRDNLGVVEQKNNENPFFDNATVKEMDFGLCKNELLLMDYCSQQLGSSYIYDYLFNLVFPDRVDVAHMADEDIHRYAFLTSYLFLIELFAEKDFLPNVKLYRSAPEEAQDVDVMISLGTESTSVLLVENEDLKSVTSLQLTNFTNPFGNNAQGDSIDMQIAFRTEMFGDCGPKKSRQFAYPSYVRIGKEAGELISAASECAVNDSSMYSLVNPKRYLADYETNGLDWKNIVLNGEPENNAIPEIPNFSRYTSATGELNAGGIVSQEKHFSKHSLMMFSLVELINQAFIQINSNEYRAKFGEENCARKIKNIIVTSSPAMLKSERDALLGCVADAVTLFEKSHEIRDTKISVVPQYTKRGAEANVWYYDECTCAQLVYLYGELNCKYKGCNKEYFNLYQQNKNVPLTIGSVDLGAGTTDILVNEYNYQGDESLTVAPSPLFFDSFNKGGDSLLKELIKNVILEDVNSAFRKKLSGLSTDLYQQFLHDFFGDFDQYSYLKKNVSVQYFMPLAKYFLHLLRKNSCDSVVKYDDVFAENPVAKRVIDELKANVNVWLQKKGEKDCNFDLTEIEWQYNAAQVSDCVFAVYEPLLKKVATIMHAYSCDVILLTGNPASYPAIREIFLKYYAISPDRLISMNNYYVGTWYPFSQNTGYIENSKTVAPIGGLIAYYDKEKSFVDTEALGKNFDTSKIVQYVEGKKIGTRTSYLMTPLIKQGMVDVKTFPMQLCAKQIDLESYPVKVVYTIAVDKAKQVERIRRQFIASGNMTPSDEEIQSELEKVNSELQEKMPLKITVERNYMNKDALVATTVIDKDGVEITDSCIEIQSSNFGIEENKWMETGMFEF
ncbi:MAG: virulence factor SrfB [Bacteroidales bacterium]|nr:virulence factor SrfB [Bacteroidales bacterium]